MIQSICITMICGRSRWDGYDLHAHLWTVHGQSVTLRKTTHHCPIQGLWIFMYIMIVKSVVAKVTETAGLFPVARNICIGRLQSKWIPKNVIIIIIVIVKYNLLKNEMFTSFYHSPQKLSQQRTGARD